MISVIIPIYNAEKYLGECLLSVLSQTIGDIEVICINDGSTDGSLQILQEYAIKDSRIKIIDQNNQGVSAARNAGIELASGIYLSFVDGDDWLKEDFLEKLVEAAKKYSADIVISDFLAQVGAEFYRNTNAFTKNKVFARNDIEKEIYPALVKTDNLNSSCNKLFLRSFIVDNKIRFPLGITNGEDASFVRQAFSKATTSVFIDDVGYYYRENQGSASRNVLQKDYTAIALNYFNDSFAELQGSIPSDEIQKFKAIRLANNLMSLISMVHQTDLPFRKKLVKTRKIINTPELQESLLKYWVAIRQNQSRYNRFLLENMRKRNALMISLACRYANYKNKK